MKYFLIEAKKDSPKVQINFNDGIFDMKGESTLQKPVIFYRIILRWIKVFSCLGHGNKTINIHLSQINSSSSRWIFKLLKQFELSSTVEERIKVNWFYNNKSVFLKGCRYKNELHIPINLIAS